MTLKNLVRTITIPSDGTAKTFNYPFGVFSQTHVAVTVTSPTGAGTTLVLSTDGASNDFTVAASGILSTAGSITLLDHGQAWLSNGRLILNWTITIERIVPYTQETNVRGEGPYNADIHETEYDLLMMAIQQLRDGVGLMIANGGVGISKALPQPLGIANPGASNLVSAGDHVHPTTGLALSGDLTTEIAARIAGDSTEATSRTAAITAEATARAAADALLTPKARTLTGTAPIQIAGDNAAHDLSADRTISIINGTTSVVGAVQLAADGGTSANTVVQGNDSRLLGTNFYRAHQFKCVDAPNAWNFRAGSADVTYGALAIADTLSGRWESATTGSVSGNMAGREASGTPGFTRGDRLFIQHSHIATGTSLATTKWFCGVSYGIVNAFTAVGSWSCGFLFDYSVDASHFIGYTCNNTTEQKTILSSVATSTVYSLKVDVSKWAASSTIDWYINDALIATSTPGGAFANSQDMDPQTMIKTYANSATFMYFGPQHIEQY